MLSRSLAIQYVEKQIGRFILAGLAALFVLVSVLHANLCLYAFPNVEGYGLTNNPSPTLITKAYPLGWPLTSVAVEPNDLGYWILPIERDGVYVLSYAKLATNVAVSLIMSAATYFHAARHYRRIRPQFGLSTTIVSISTIATVAALNRDNIFFWGQCLNNVSFFGITLGIWSVWLTIVGFASFSIDKLKLVVRSR